MNALLRRALPLSVVLALTLASVPSGSSGKATVPDRPTAHPKSAAPGNHRLTIRVGGLDRRYTVHVPPRDDGKAKLPVVVMLHGGGGTGQAADTETGWSAKADASHFLAVFPNALARDPSNPSSFAANPQLWNDGSERFYQGQQAVDDVAFLTAMLDDLGTRFPVDAQRVYFTGFSNGASMAFMAGAALSRRVAAIAPVAGACWVDTVRLDRPVPMLYITGTADPLNLLQGGVPRLAFGAAPDGVRAKAKPPVRDSIRKWAGALGCPDSAAGRTDANGVRTETYGPCREGSEVVYVTVEGMGHTWAGGRSLLPEFMVGKRSDKLRATDLVWDFFRKHSAPRAEANEVPGETARAGTPTLTPTRGETSGPVPRSTTGARVADAGPNRARSDGEARVRRRPPAA
jgi:polyhydroxybutyrate depolymerase